MTGCVKTVRKDLWMVGPIWILKLTVRFFAQIDENFCLAFILVSCGCYIFSDRFGARWSMRVSTVAKSEKIWQAPLKEEFF
jgi:hypothetical protein